MHAAIPSTAATTSRLLTMLTQEGSVETLQENSSAKAVLATFVAVFGFALISFGSPQEAAQGPVAVAKPAAQVALQAAADADETLLLVAAPEEAAPQPASPMQKGMIRTSAEASGSR